MDNIAMRFGAIVAVALGIIWGTPVKATVIGGMVTGGSALTNGGTFVSLPVPLTGSTPFNTVGDNNFQTDNLYAFSEDQNIVIGGTVVVNIGTNPVAGDIVARRRPDAGPDDPIDREAAVPRSRRFGFGDVSCGDVRSAHSIRRPPRRPPPSAGRRWREIRRDGSQGAETI